MVVLSAYSQTEEQIHGWETILFPRYTCKDIEGFQHRYMLCPTTAQVVVDEF